MVKITDLNRRNIEGYITALVTFPTQNQNIFDRVVTICLESGTTIEQALGCPGREDAERIVQEIVQARQQLLNEVQGE